MSHSGLENTCLCKPFLIVFFLTICIIIFPKTEIKLMGLFPWIDPLFWVVRWLSPKPWHQQSNDLCYIFCVSFELPTSITTPSHLIKVRSFLKYPRKIFSTVLYLRTVFLLLLNSLQMFFVVKPDVEQLIIFKKIIVSVLMFFRTSLRKTDLYLWHLVFYRKTL